MQFMSNNINSFCNVFGLVGGTETIGQHCNEVLLLILIGDTIYSQSAVILLSRLIL